MGIKFNPFTSNFDITGSSGGGSGDVSGPASSTDNALVRFDGAGGKTIQNSTVTLGDTGAINNTVTANGVVPLTLKGTAGQTANHIESIRGSDSALTFSVDKNGSIYAMGDVTLNNIFSTDGVSRIAFGNTGADPEFLFTTKNNSTDIVSIGMFQSQKATNRGLIVKGFTSQSANLLEFRDSDDNVLTYFDSDGIYSGGGGGGANTALSNLASTALNASIIPAVDDTVSLGDLDGGKEFKDIFAKDVFGSQALHTNKISLVSGSSLTVEASLSGNTGGNWLIKTRDEAGASSSKSLFLQTGTTSDTVTSGDLTINTGDSDGPSGSLSIHTGTPAAGFISGGLSIYTGDTNTQISGNISIFTGETVNEDSGSLSFNTGSSDTGSSGSMSFGTGSAGANRGSFTFSGKNMVLQTDRFSVPTTVTAGGTTGNRTINKISGTVNFAASATAITVTNGFVTANSIVMAVVRTNDTTATIKNVVPSSGSFIITLTAAATAETSVGFFVVNG